MAPKRCLNLAIPNGNVLLDKLTQHNNISNCLDLNNGSILTVLNRLYNVYSYYVSDHGNITGTDYLLILF